MSSLRHILLRPLSMVFGATVSLRNLLYDHDILSSHSFTSPVICVGNIAVGGTGKTPHVTYLAEMLSHYMPVAIVSRGYLRKSRGFRLVQVDDTVQISGDEPLQMAHSLPDVRVFVDRDRVHGVREILKLYPDIKVIILDDGFQHRHIKAGLNIILTSFSRLMTRDHLMPLGRLRENIRGLKRADMVIVTKTPPDATADEIMQVEKEVSFATPMTVFFSTFTYGKLKPLFSGITERGITKDTGVVLVTGIADPAPLNEYVTKMAGTVIHIPFRDHHSFTNDDFERISLAFNDLKQADKIIITTEKDSVRLKELSIIAIHLRERLFYLPVKVKFVEKEEDFIKIITEYAGKNH